MMNKEMKWFMAGLPLLSDVLVLIALLTWLPVLEQQLRQPSGGNALLIVTGYILFCAGVYFLRKLLPASKTAVAGRPKWSPPAWFMNPRVRGVLGLFFGIIMTTTLASQLGYFDAILDSDALGRMGEGDTAAFLVFAPGAWLGFSMLYILLLAFPVNANVPPGGSRYRVQAFIALLLLNNMLLLATAQASAWLTRPIPGGQALSFAVTFFFLLLLFAPPRLLYQSRQPHLPGLVSFVALLLYCTWRIVL